MTTEYIAKIKGDISGLEKTLKDAQGRLERLNENEVVIKFDYDSNEKELNKIIQGVINKSPELDIEFKYNINKAALEQETKKLEQMEMSADSSKLVEEIRKVHSEYQSIFQDASDDELNLFEKKLSSLYQSVLNLEDGLTALSKLPEEIQEQLEDLEEVDPVKMATSSDIEKQREIVNELRTSMEKLQESAQIEMNTGNVEQSMDAVEKQIFSTTDSLKNLFAAFSEYSEAHDNKHISKFWDELKSKIEQGDEEAKKLLSDLNLIENESGKVNIVSAGNVKSGGIIGDNTVLLASHNRKKNGADRLQNTVDLKKRLEDAASAGANVAKILDIIYDSEKNVFFELQEKAKGNMLGDYETGWVNPDIFQATDEQIKKLIDDIKLLDEIGIGVDINPTNILYDKEKGFSFIDLDLDPAKWKDTEEFINDIKGGITGTLSDFYEDLGNQDGKKAVEEFEKRIDIMASSVRESVNELAEATKEQQQSNSPSKVASNLGEDWGQGYADGIRSKADEVRSAAEELVEAAKSGLEESDLKVDTTFADKAFSIDTKQTDNDKFNESIADITKNLQKQADSFQGNSAAVEQAIAVEEKYELAVSQTTEELQKRAKAVDDAFRSDVGMADNDIVSQAAEIERVQGEIVETTTALSTSADTIQEKFEQVVNALVTVISWYEKLGDYGATDTAQDLGNETKALSDLSTNAEEAATSKKKVKDENVKLKQSADDTAKSIDKETKAVEKFVDKAKRESKQQDIRKFMADNKNLSESTKAELEALIKMLEKDTTPSGLAKINAEFKKIKVNAQKAGETGSSWFDKWVKQLGSMTRYFASFVSFYKVIDIFKSAVSTVTDLDTALTEMRKVSDETYDSLRNYQNLTFDVAGEIGTTALSLQNSTADWMRLGESLEDAAESARTATVLLNVSEFSNIEDATKALVSASQAYKELDKMEIVDVLNNIGNNFSISTDELATGLQNAAAVLKTQGNDLNEAVALLTAGNAITQDISKASAGIRTIALRIAGTEEAKDELKEMGEDVDDFIVGTNAKMQQLIKDYTAVASNAYKGVDILDANGNLRNTYDILLDIAKVYQEILDTDKKAGTNRGQALVEAIAGEFLPERYGQHIFKNIFNCIDCLKLHATIIGKPDYDGLTSWRYMANLQPSTLTLHLDHRLDKSRVKVQRLFPCRDLKTK